MENNTDHKRQAAIPEPMPTPSKDDVLPEVIKDLEARSIVGQKKYGTVLQANNNRYALMDLYQELLDGIMYLKQHMMENNGKNRK